MQILFFKMKNVKKRLIENFDTEVEVYSHEEDFFNGMYTVMAESNQLKYRSPNLFFKVYDNKGDNDEWDLLAAFDVTTNGDIEPTQLRNEEVEFPGKLYCVDNDKAADELVDIINACVDEWSDGSIVLDLNAEDFIIDGSEEYLGSYDFDSELRKEQGLPERDTDDYTDDYTDDLDDLDSPAFESKQFNRRKRRGGCCRKSKLDEGLKDTLKATPDKIKNALKKVSLKIGSNNQGMLKKAVSIVDTLESKNVPLKKYMKAIKDLPAFLSDENFEDRPEEEQQLACKVMVIMTLLASGVSAYEIISHCS